MGLSTSVRENVFCGIALALVATAALGACTHYRTPGDRLRMSVMDYNNSIRWQYWKAAAKYVPPDKREDFVTRKEAQQDTFRVTEYEVRDVDHDDSVDPPEARVLVDFTWHRYPSLTVQHTRVRQTWKMLVDDWTLLDQEEVEIEAPPTTAKEMF